METYIKLKLFIETKALVTLIRKIIFDVINEQSFL